MLSTTPAVQGFETIRSPWTRYFPASQSRRDVWRSSHGYAKRCALLDHLDRSGECAGLDEIQCLRTLRQRMSFARVGEETQTDPPVNLRKSSRPFPIKTNLSSLPATLPAVLQLLSPDSETLFNGNPQRDVLNLGGSRAHIFAMHGPATDAAEDAPHNLFSTKNGAPGPASHQRCK